LKLLRFLLRAAGPMAFVMALLGILCSGFNAGLVATIHQTLLRGASLAFLLIFVGVGAGKVLCSFCSAVLLTRYSYEAITQLRQTMMQKLLAFPYLRFERMGREKVLAALTEDVATVNAALQSAPSFLVNVAIVAGSCGYLFFLSWHTFLALVAVGALGWLAYRPLSRSALPYLERAREEHDRLFGHFHALTQGSKELKQHAGRRAAFLEEHVLETTEALAEQHVLGQARFQLSHAASSVISLLAVALILFIAPRWNGLPAGAVVGYVLAALYLMGPFSGALRVLPLYTTAEISLGRIERLGAELDRDAEQHNASPDDRPHFASIQLRDVEHAYHDERTQPGFRLGPLSLELRPGQVVFITGENGSGKSTLAKLLVGLYEPDCGEVLWDGRKVTDATRDAYRQLFSVVFSDYYLFETLMGLPEGELDERAEILLSRLQLDGHVEINAGELSSLQLSQGQRKRVALLTAYLEDRPIYVFDEWASDQDPAFKDVFYNELVPELKARGKAVVVITHDDRYFQLADRHVMLHRGRIGQSEITSKRLVGT
jgi:putative ATP-binding cassette transporter